MNILVRKFLQLSADILNAFRKFPAAMLCAFAFALVTVIKINLGWPQQEPYNFLFRCLHLSLAFGAIFSLAAITAAQSVCDSRKAFLLANILGFSAAAAAFFSLYYWGGLDPAMTGYRYRVLSSLAEARATAAMLVSFLSFVTFAGYPRERSDFARSSFMTLKALVIALVYGGTIMAGLSGVAGAVQALLYNAMSEKVYMYIGTLSGFLGFAIFVGYFPDFRRHVTDPRWQEATEQPPFAQVLFSSIMIPVMTALTAVLLIWTVKSLLTGIKVPFERLSSIATSYAVAGLWLHIMVTHHQSNISRFYRRFFPYAALVILAFEARALMLHLSTAGLKTTEYWFIITWIMAAAGAVLLIIKKEKAHLPMVVLTCFLAVISVLPVVGYHRLPVTYQVHRLQELLVSQGMFKEGQLLPAAAEPDLQVRQAITDAVIFLAYSQDAKLPSWFDRDLANPEKFKTQFGFEQAWPKPEVTYPSESYMATNLHKPNSAVDISEYSWALTPRDIYGPEIKPATINGKRGLYKIYWRVNTPDDIPNLRITLNDKEILNENLNPYVDRITQKYPPGSIAGPKEVSLEDLTVEWETPELKVMLIFNSVDIVVNPREDKIYYSFDLNALYLKEN